MSDRLNTSPVLSLIVARALNGVIGNEGDMPWKLSADLKRFKQLTKGKPVIMGRKTWDSLPRKPLPGRPNIVVSRNPDLCVEGAQLVSGLSVASAFASAIATQTGVDEYFVIGGATLYEAALPSAQRLYLTEVLASPNGDTLFPEIVERDWQEVEATNVPADEKNSVATRFRILERRL